MSRRANCVIVSVSAGEKPMIIGAPATKQANPRQVCFGSIFCFGNIPFFGNILLMSGREYGVSRECRAQTRQA
jgi:hypothetical protein